MSQPDFAVLYPNCMALVIKTIVDPERAIFLSSSALGFLKLRPPHAQTRFAGAWADDEFLSVPVPKPRFGLITGRAINGLPPG